MFILTCLIFIGLVIYAFKKLNIKVTISVPDNILESFQSLNIPPLPAIEVKSYNRKAGNIKQKPRIIEAIDVKLDNKKSPEKISQKVNSEQKKKEELIAFARACANGDNINSETVDIKKKLTTNTVGETDNLTSIDVIQPFDPDVQSEHLFL